MAINWATLKAQIIDAAVVAVNAVALNTASRAEAKAPVRKVFSGGRQTVRFKTAEEVNRDAALFARMGMKPEIAATPEAIAAVRARGLNPIRSKRIGGEEFGFARTVEAPGRIRRGGPTTQSYMLTGEANPRAGESIHSPRKTLHPDVVRQGRPRNLSNRANEMQKTWQIRVLDPLNYAQLQNETAENQLTARGRYELASKRAISARVRVDHETGRPIVIARVGGALRASIRVVKATAEMYPVIKASVVAGNKEVDYARWQELGNRHNPAHPFLRPALAEAREELPGALLRSLRRLGR